MRLLLLLLLSLLLMWLQLPGCRYDNRWIFLRCLNHFFSRLDRWWCIFLATILAAFTLANLITENTGVSAFTIFLKTFCFLATTPFFGQPGDGIYLHHSLILWHKRILISHNGLLDSYSAALFVVLSIPAFKTIAFFIADDLKSETLTVKLKTLWFFTIAANKNFWRWWRRTGRWTTNTAVITSMHMRFLLNFNSRIIFIVGTIGFNLHIFFIKFILMMNIMVII